MVDLLPFIMVSIFSMHARMVIPLIMLHNQNYIREKNISGTIIERVYFYILAWMLKLVSAWIILS